MSGSTAVESPVGDARSTAERRGAAYHRASAVAERDRLDALAAHDDYRLQAWANRSDQSVANWGFMSLARPGARQNLIRAVWNACESIDTLRFLDLTACRLQVAEME